MSDEPNTPAGADVPAGTPAPTGNSRADLDAAIKQRDRAKTEARDLEAKLTAVMAASEAERVRMSAELADARGLVRRRDFADAALAGVPTMAQRAEADLLLTGLIARDKIDPTTDGWEALAASAAERLKTIAPRLFEIGQPAQPSTSTVAAGAKQTGTTGEVNWGAFKSKSDIPRELWGKVPPKVWNSLPADARDKINI